MIIQTGTEVEVVLIGHKLRINAKCNDIKHEDGFGGGYYRAHWTVKMSYRGRAASFKYKVGDGNVAYDTELDFDCFAECIISDMRVGESSYDDFCDVFGYSDSTTNRGIYNKCARTVEKLNRVFSFRRTDFVERAEKGDWECLLASAEESLNSE